MPRALAAVLVLLSWAAVSTAVAQRRELTLLVGGNMTGATGPGIDQVVVHPGFVGGLSLRIPRTAQFSVQLELLGVQHRVLGQRPPSNQSPIQSGPLADSPNLVFAEFPVLLRIQRGYSMVHPVRPYLVAGGYGAIRLACHHDITEANGTMHRTDCSATTGDVSPGSGVFIPAVYQDLDVGLVGGVGVEIHQFTVGARFERSIRNLVEPGAVPTSPLEKSRLWSVSFAVEYLVRVL